MEEDVVEIPPPVNRTSNSLKRKEVRNAHSRHFKTINFIISYRAMQIFSSSVSLLELVICLVVDY